MEVQMDSYARRLSGISGLFNLSVALALLFLRPSIGPMLGLDPVSGRNLQLPNATAALIAIFCYAYWCVAIKPRRYRVYIEIGVIGKLMVVAVMVWPALTGAAGWT